MEITSLQHPVVKDLVKLRTSRAFRKERNAALISGRKLISELGSVKTLLCTKEAKPLAVKAEKKLLVTPQILKKITGVEEPEPYAAEISLPAPGDLSGKKFLLALDKISDPGNLGTLLRTALALGWEGVFLLDGCVDPFNDKALRAAKGATFHLPLLEGTAEELLELIEKNGLRVYLSGMRGKRVETQKIEPPLILVLGSESHGVTFSPKEAITLTIPIQGVESLNVATAGAILMHQMRQA